MIEKYVKIINVYNRTHGYQVVYTLQDLIENFAKL